MKETRHTQQIPAAVMKEAQLKADELQALLAPYVFALTPDERHTMLKMGSKTVSFVEKSYDYARQNPQFCQPYLDMDAFQNDFSDAHGIWTLLNTVRQLADGLDDTQMLAGSEAFQAALIFYSSIRTAAAQDIAGAKAIYEELSTRFPSGSHKPIDDGIQASDTGSGVKQA